MNLHPDPAAEVVTIGQAVAIPPGTVGYITASDEGHALRRQRPLRKAGMPMGTITRNNSRLMDNGKTRSITRAEAGRFQSFPGAFAWRDDWRLCLGNAVPPLLMRAIARHIRLVVLPAARREDAAA